MSGEVSNNERLFQSFDEDGKALNVVSIQTSEMVTLAFDFSSALDSDDALASPSVDVTEVGSSDLTIANVAVRHSRINFDVTAGVASDTTYLVRAVATTVDGVVLSRTGAIHGA